MYRLEIEPLDLGADVRAIGLELAEADDNREPVRGEPAARIWARVLQSTAADEPWALDFFSHLDRVREYCQRQDIAYHQANQRTMVIPAPQQAPLAGLLARFEGETFGARAGARMAAGAPRDSALEAELARRGVDAYHAAFPHYFFCAVCAPEDGSLVLLSEKLWASEVIRRVRPNLKTIGVEVQLPN